MFRYQLDKSSKKFRCPSCHKKTFVRYMDYQENEYLPLEYGRCDREIKCGYFYKYSSQPGTNSLLPTAFSEIEALPNYHPYSLVEQSQKTISKNQLIRFLLLHFKSAEVQKIIQSYRLGNAPYWYDGTIFWQLDQDLNVCGGKIMRYGENGKRFGTPYWVHSYLKRSGEIEAFNLVQCLFGLHLIGTNDQPIAVVESEKTACIMSVIDPRYLWMATGSLHGLHRDKLLPIKDRNITLYPDTGINRKGKSPFEQWAGICDKLKEEGFHISVSDVLEKNTTKKQKEAGYDLADLYL